MRKIFLVDKDSEFRSSVESLLRTVIDIAGVNGEFDFVHLNDSEDFKGSLRSGNGGYVNSLTITDQVKVVRLAKVVQSSPIFYDEGFNFQSRGIKAVRYGAVAYFGKRNANDEVFFMDKAREILQNGSNPH
ncbi:MAG: hypothetical protein AABW63_00540 [Nanoarchaeota archaeon]